MKVRELLERSKMGFGRLPALDPRDLGFPMRLASGFDPEAATELKYRHWKMGATLDQLRTPHCVEFMWRQMLAASPVRNIWAKTTGWLYKEAQKIDEWPGEGYDGTSVRAGAKIVQREGYLSTYTWADDIDDIIVWLATQGPVGMGTTWKSNMMRPDPDGFIRATGFDEGGHAYLISGFNRTEECPDDSRGAFTIVNSWGTGWGRNGRAKISFNDMAKLLADWGESCTPLELKFTPMNQPQAEEFA